MRLFVGQGRIADAEGERVRLDDTGETVAVTWALPYRYHPRVYDAVTVMGSGELFYVTGLVRGRGRVEVDCAGDLPIACAGRMRLSGRAGVELHGEQVTLRAKTLRTLSGLVHEKLGRASRWARNTLRERAGESWWVVKEDATTRARRSHIKVEGVVRVDAKQQIRVGH